MNKRIKKLWIAALRSGKYKQGGGALRFKDTFCCLGVLCDLHAKQHRKSWVPLGDNSYSYAGDTCVLPEPVMEWAAITDDDPKLGRRYNSVIRAAALNDSGKDFNYIADRIEKHL